MILSPVLTNLSFLKLWIPQILTIVGQNALTYVIGIRIWQATGSNTAVGTLLVVSAIPGVLFGLFAGAYVDRWDTRRTIIITNIIRTVIIASFIFLVNVPLLVYPLILALSLVTQFFIPAESSAIPRVVHKEDLISANSLFALSFTLASAVGFLLSTPAIRLLGIDGTIIAAIILFLISTAITFTLPKIEGRSGGEGIVNIFVELVSAARLIITDKILRGGVFSLILGNGFILILASLVPGYAARTLGVDAEDASLFVLAPAIVGIAVGSLFLNRVKKDETTLNLPKYGILIMGLGLIIASFLGPVLLGQLTLLVSTLVLFTIGVANSLTTVPSTTIIHRHTPPNFQGRIFGFINTFANAASLLPIILTGGVADVFGVPAAMQFMGLLIALFGVYRLRTVYLRNN